MHTQGIKYVYMQIFMIVAVSVIEILLFKTEEEKAEAEKHGTTVKVEITCLTSFSCFFTRYH